MPCFGAPGVGPCLAWLRHLARACHTSPRRSPPPTARTLPVFPASLNNHIHTLYSSPVRLTGLLMGSFRALGKKRWPMVHRNFPVARNFPNELRPGGITARVCPMKHRRISAQVVDRKPGTPIRMTGHSRRAAWQLAQGRDGTLRMGKWRSNGTGGGRGGRRKPAGRGGAGWDDGTGGRGRRFRWAGYRREERGSWEDWES